ncbi:MAG: alkaline phosphatase family protein [Chitinophagia bacterium]|jgi:predicted AlkP superfamily pyrophosphatase or phosphodiesterase|nr:alkaline phosphatase family protein [Chitinophagia bacterium]
MRFTLLLIVGLITTQTFAQKTNSVKATDTKPKLVVGIVVDQMRWDYVNKFKPFFKTQNGFLKLMNQGASCNNNLIPYLPTVTACGHTAVYTGSTPAIHGITGNSWYDNIQQRMVYCVEDNSVQAVGIENSSAGKMSPLNVWTTTIGDELKLATNFKSKVFGVSLKDRGAIIPAGHSADGAFWYDSKSGNFISSTYYGKSLPTWLTNYNNAKKVDSFYKLGWSLSLPANVYEANCDTDQNEYESIPFGKDAKGFPYGLNQFIGKDYGKVANTPYGNNLVLDVATQTIINEKMGLDDITDLLAVSFSSPDYIGHAFGPNSWETLDGYIKLDELLAQFFTTLDQQVGKDNYTVFLTADHAVAPIPGYAQKHKIPAGTITDDGIKNELGKMLTAKGLNPKLISAITEFNIYFNHNLMDSLQVTQDKLTSLITNYLEQKSNIIQVVESRKAAIAPLPQSIRERIVNGFNPQRSGDLMFITKSGVVGGGNTGTGHGVFYNYDAHIPLLFYGKGIKKGQVNNVNYMTDIAPTITTLLGIQMPSGSIGKPILEVIQ